MSDFFPNFEIQFTLSMETKSLSTEQITIFRKLNFPPEKTSLHGSKLEHAILLNNGKVQLKFTSTIESPFMVKPVIFLRVNLSWPV